MSSTIFRIKIIDHALQHMEAEVLLNYFYSIPRWKFKYVDYLKLFGIDIPKAENVRTMSHQTFVNLLSQNIERITSDCLSKIPELVPLKIENFNQSYESNVISDLISPKTLIWNNILASLDIEHFKKRPISKLVLQIAQDQDGIVAFPRHRGLGINSIIYREFMLRVLTGIENDFQTESKKLSNWININKIDLYPQYPNKIDFSKTKNDIGVEGIIWGIREENEIVIGLDDANFIEKYKGEWWLERIKSNFEYWKADYPEWSEENKDYPFRVKTFSILLHPAFFKRESLSNSFDEIYNSTAYGY